MAIYTIFCISGLLVGLSCSHQLGEECITPAKERGRCVNITQCDMLYTLVLEIGNKTFPDDFNKIVQSSKCGNGDPYVCCSSVDEISNRSSLVELKYNALLPDRTLCGFEDFESFWLGLPTDLHEFPWIVLLEYGNNKSKQTQKCEGVLINNRYVLTAAHCSFTKDRLTGVRLGEWDTSTDIDCNPVGSDYCSDKPLEIPVEEILVHPNFNLSSSNSHNDIALLRLNQTVKFTKFVKPICLPLQSESLEHGSAGLVSGWGYNVQKQTIGIPIIPNPYCKVLLSEYNVTIVDTQLCAGGGETTKACSTGDRGGPLMTREAISYRWYVEGILSYGPECGSTRPNLPRVYTRVSEYLKWIHENVQE